MNVLHLFCITFIFAHTHAHTIGMKCSLIPHVFFQYKINSYEMYYSHNSPLSLKPCILDL